MQKLAIIGSGDLGQLIAYHAVSDGHYAIAGFFDDYREKGTLVKQHPVLGGTADILQLFKEGVFDCLMVAIGYRHFEQRCGFFDQFYGQVPFGNVIHSSSYVDASCILGTGVFILPGCVLDNNVVLGDNVVLNTGVCIAHDSEIAKHSFISPRVAIAGFVKIGSGCNIGINTTVIDNIKISDNVQTGGGTVVTKNLEQKGLYVGSPARFIR